MSSYISTCYGCDGLRIYGDFAVHTAKIWKQVNVHCSIIPVRHHATGDKEHRKQQDVTLCQTAHPPVLQLSVIFRGVMSDCMKTNGQWKLWQSANYLCMVNSFRSSSRTLLANLKSAYKCAKTSTTLNLRIIMGDTVSWIQKLHDQFHDWKACTVHTSTKAA